MGFARTVGLWCLERLYSWLFVIDKQLTMTYFDVPGIAQCVRNLFNDFNINYENCCVSHEQFEAMKLPYKELPVLRVGTEVFEHSNAILRYAGKLTRTYAMDPIHSLGIDELIDQHTDFVGRIQCHLYPANWGLECMDEDTRAKQCTWLIREWIPKHLQFLETHLRRGTYLGGSDTPTIADYCWKATLIWLKAGGLPPYVPDDWSYSINSYCESNTPWIDESESEEGSEQGNAQQANADDGSDEDKPEKKDPPTVSKCDDQTCYSCMH